MGNSESEYFESIYCNTPEQAGVNLESILKERYRNNKTIIGNNIAISVIVHPETVIKSLFSAKDIVNRIGLARVTRTTNTLSPRGLTAPMISINDYTVNFSKDEFGMYKAYVKIT